MSANNNNTNESQTGFWISAIAGVVLLLIVAVLTTAAMVREAVKDDDEEPTGAEKKEFIVAVAEFPGKVRRVLREVTGTARNPLLIEKAKIEKPHWVRKFPAPEDDGYLLLAGMDPDIKHSAVKLIRIADGQVMAQWAPDWDAIYAKLTDKKWEPLGESDRGVAFHPVLLDGGDIIFNTRTGMARSSVCSTQPVWVLNQAMHHSNEMALDGNSIWSPSIAEGYFSQNAALEKRLRDDSLARVSLDGKVLENHSVVKILIDNGLRAIVLGTTGHMFPSDPIHLNHISVAPSDSKYWQRGDLLISIRNRSLVFLYRPSTGKIIWHQLGPWLNQHSARFVDDRRISVLDNNVYSGAAPSQPFVHPGDINHVFVYDFETRTLSEPWAELLAKEKPVAWIQGMAQVLPDGGLLVEESNSGRHLRFTKDKLLWSRINDYDKNHVGMVARSRYLTPEEVKAPLAAITAKRCNSI